MTAVAELTCEQVDAFDRSGVVRLTGLLSANTVRQAREAILRQLERIGLWRDGEWRLESGPRPRYPYTGVSAKEIGNKHPELEALLREPGLVAAVEALLEGRAFERAIYKRPQALVTLPNAETWTVPTGWHVDIPRFAGGERPGVQMFTFLDRVGSHGGGTLVLAGSHRLLNNTRFIRTSDVHRLLRQEGYVRALYGDASVGEQAQAATLGAPGRVGDVDLDIVELSGAPGDVWFMDLRLLHATAPNARDRPRLMATHRFLRADLAPQMAQLWDA